ncbi:MULTISPECIES: DUF389 domain-containing protein [Aestuariimicrobium]|uniref:DUF389 domain-containing protein n=1 Tax=Aestuariimicrobium TaxID=396388 RepID=UPI0003B3A856|nr:MULTISPECIES: DUF389 domain-containing protein [Aestuariimicrobium]CAI9405491.1 hypothetical protein AESSP_01423 [Aestuariimicrobium sp. T2.26MG-19.2B]
MLTVTVKVPSDLTEVVLGLCEGDVAISSVAVARGQTVMPPGDVITIDIAREAGDGLLQRLREAQVPQHGTVLVQPVATWLSSRGLRSERAAPGDGTDAVLWAEVVQGLRADSQFTWVFATTICMATLLAAVAIVLDSPILVVGAMILGPEFGAIAGTAVGLLRGRRGMVGRAVATLLGGFGLAMAVTALFGVICRGLGWITSDQVTGARPATAFIYSPDKWSIIVGLIAASAGVLAITSGKRDGLSGAFVSVTTIPAAANVALGLVFGAWPEVIGSGLQLAINLTAMTVAGWLTLVVQQRLWARVRATWHARRRP